MLMLQNLYDKGKSTRKPNYPTFIKKGAGGDTSMYNITNMIICDSPGEEVFAV